MSDKPLDEMLDTAYVGTHSADAKRAANRRLFREMVKGETEGGPLNLPRRRALIRFARRLAIQSAEAKLIIRGVEFERGFVPAETVLELMRGDAGERSAPLDLEAGLRIGFYVLLTLLYCMLIRWVIGLVF